MDWARDQVGNLIHASQQGLFSYGWSCPACGEPVRRRAGTQRRPHFAHYSYSAKPECENYYPAWSVITTPGLRRIWAAEHAALGAPSLQCGLFLEGTDRGSYSLYLKLPQLLADSGGSGEIEIRSGLGVRTYTASQLQRPRLVPVAPQVPLAEVTAVGDLAAAGVVIRAQVQRFRSWGNYFRASEHGGRLLAPEEPLEWGERYRLLTQQALGPVPEAFELEVEFEQEQRGWHAYGVGLPNLSEEVRESGREALGGYLGRTIRPPRARAYFVDPPPHHVGPDGTHVFSETTDRILLRRTALSRISTEGTLQL